LTRLKIFGTVAFLAAFFLAQNSYAKGYCVPSKEAVKAVEEHNEVLVFRGLSKRGHLVSIYLAPDGTFSALVHYPEGKSCFVDFGHSGEVITDERK
jgi:hypothetical protein